jgi:hypothetical protein
MCIPVKGLRLVHIVHLPVHLREFEIKENSNGNNGKDGETK